MTSIGHIIQRTLPVPLAHKVRALNYFHRIGEPEIQLVRHLCDSARVSVDVGANIGDYTHEMRRRSKACIAFEPNPALAKELRKRFSSRVQVHNVALSDERCMVDLCVPVIDDTPYPALAFVVRDKQAAGSYRVECRPLDSFDLPPCSLIKIDVEGHELSVLKGAADTLHRQRPSLIIEAEERHRPDAVGQLAEFLDPFGYHGFFYLHGERRPLAAFDPEEHQNVQSIDDVQRRPGAVYINNFIFVAQPDALPSRLPRG